MFHNKKKENISKEIIPTSYTVTTHKPYSTTEATTWNNYYNADITGKSIFFRRRLALALELIDTYFCIGDGSVADLGCGAGQLTIELLKRGFTVTAFDHSDEMLRLTQHKVRSLQYAKPAMSSIMADLNGYQFSSSCFEAVCALGCLEFLRDVPSSIARISSSIRPGGFFLLSMPNVYSPFTWPERIARCLLRLLRPARKPGCHNTLSLDQVKSIMQKNELTLIDVYFTFPATFLGNRSFPPVFFLRRLTQVRKYPLAPFLANTWIALFRKVDDKHRP